jgi:DNA-binding MarR family transcriptional regulator
MAEPGRPPGTAPGRLEEEIRQRAPLAHPAERAFLNLLRSAAVIGQEHARFLDAYGLTPAQYNVLRILRGADPETLPCREVGARLVAPGPDVTRLLDRLEAAGLVRRERDPGDRRVVRAGITERGRERLAPLDAPLARWIRRRLGGLSRAELGALSGLLERARAERGPERGRPDSGAGSE